jgi:preprotein translocase subunit YajC
MKKLALFALVGLFVASFAFAQSQQPPQQQQPSGYPEQPSASEKQMSNAPIMGTVDKVDLTGKSITVKIDKTGETRTFTFDDKTKWDAKEKTFKADSLKVGDQVTITSDSTNLASKIKVKAGMTPSEKPQQ